MRWYLAADEHLAMLTGLLDARQALAALKDGDRKRCYKVVQAGETAVLGFSPHERLPQG